MPLPLGVHTQATRQAERLVRDPHLFKWYAVALLALVIYAYANEIERRRFDVVAAGLAVWFADWFNDAPDDRRRWRRVGALAGIDVAMGLVFGVALGWL